MRKKKRCKESGVSLVEVMIAVVVMVVGLLALAQLLVVAINQNAMSRSTSVGITVAQGKLEELRTLYNAGLKSGVDAADMTLGTHGPDHVDLPSGFGSDSRTYLVSWTVTQVVAAEKTVEVRVQPEKGANFLNSRSVSITSHFAP